METDLHIAGRLRKLLEPLTPEERKQLKANIEGDGLVTDPIIYWFDGKQNVILDGMNRWEIVKGTEIPYRTKKLTFASYDDAEIWILDHQLGRRNLLKPAAIRKVRGELYNRLKASKGGDRPPQSERAKCQIDTLVSTSGGSAAKKVAEKAGVSEATVKRDGARVEAEAKLSKAAKAISEKASDAEVKALAKLDKPEQDKVARAIRTGQAESLKDALKLKGKPPKKSKPDYGKCPNCAGTKWDEDEEGVSCRKCHHPYGESTGGADDDRLKTQRQKTVKTAEALMRAFDDLQMMLARREHKETIESCKSLIRTAKGWK
jgi:hypothetical protein